MTSDQPGGGGEQATRRARRPRGKVSERPTDQATRRIKTAVNLSPRAMRQLGVACVCEGVTQSALVERLILANCKRYVVADRGLVADPADVQTD